jgi:hypothetical protein
MVENASNPSVPPAGSVTLFAKTDRHFYTIDDLGNVTELGIVSIGGPVSGGTSGYALYVDGSGNLAQSAYVRPGSSSLWDAAGNTVLDWASTGALVVGDGGIGPSLASSFYGWNLNQDGTGYLAGNAISFDISGNLTANSFISSGAFSANGLTSTGNLTVAGSSNLDGGAIISDGSGHINFSATSALNFYNIDPAASPYYLINMQSYMFSPLFQVSNSGNVLATGGVTMGDQSTVYGPVAGTMAWHSYSGTMSFYDGMSWNDIGAGLWAYDNVTNALRPAGPRNIENYPGQYFIDTSAFNSIGSNERQLIGTDGATAVADWGSNSPASNIFRTYGELMVGSVGLGLILNHTPAAVIDVTNSQLLASSGTAMSWAGGCPQLPDYSTIGSPVEGMIAWNFSTHLLTSYNGSAWI